MLYLFTFYMYILLCIYDKKLLFKELALLFMCDL